MVLKRHKIMKKTTVLFSLILISLGTFAQSSFQLGLRLAPNYSWISPDAENIDSEGNRFGFNYGIIGDFNIADNYAFSTGITLTNTGGKVSMPDVQEVTSAGGTTEFGYGNTVADIRLSNIEIPLTLKLKTNEIGYLKYFGQFGLGLSFNYDASADEDFTYITANDAEQTITNEDVDYGDEINLIRASLIVGLGAEYNLSGNTSFIFGLTFNNGFTNIFSEDTYQAGANGNALNNGAGGQKDQDLKAINNYILVNLGILF